MPARQGSMGTSLGQHQLVPSLGEKVHFHCHAKIAEHLRKGDPTPGYGTYHIAIDSNTGVVRIERGQYVDGGWVHDPKLVDGVVEVTDMVLGPLSQLPTPSWVVSETDKGPGPEPTGLWCKAKDATRILIEFAAWANRMVEDRESDGVAATHEDV